MKKILMLLVLIFTVFMTGCGLKTPFDYFEKYDSCHYLEMTSATNTYGETATFPDADIYMEQKNDSFIIYYTSIINNVPSKRFIHYDSLDFESYTIYDYNAQEDTWTKSYEKDEEDSNQINLFDIENYDYDKKNKVYTIKKYLDLGNIINATWHMTDDIAVFDYEYTEYYDNEPYKIHQVREYYEWGKEFNLKNQLPKI